MIERILKIVYVFAMFINVGLYGVSFILKLNVIPIQVDLSGLSAVEKRKVKIKTFLRSSITPL